MDADTAAPLLQHDQHSSSAPACADAAPPHKSASLPVAAAVVLVEEAPPYEEQLSLFSEYKRLLKLSVPASSVGVLMYIARLVIIGKVGRIGSLEQSQLALAQTVYNITGLSLVVGIASGVQTFVGAANGAGASSLKGVILQRGVVLTLLTCLVPLLGWRWLPALMALLGQDPLLASGAARYIWHVCPALPLSALIYAMSFYLQAQHVIWPLVGAMAASVSLVPLLLHLYIDRAGWDALAGAAAAVLTMNVVEVSLLMAVVVWHNKRHTPERKPWGGFSRDSLSAWRPYLAVAGPSCLMLCIAWWAFDGLTLVSGWLPSARTSPAASGILFALHALIFLLLDGIAVGVTVRTANALGARQSRVAQTVGAGLCMSLSCTIACVTPLWLTPGAVAAVYTVDPLVQAPVEASLPFLIVVLIADSMNSVLSGALRGAGRQALGSCINLACFVPGLPFAIALALHWGLGVPGLWMGMAATACLQALCLAAVFVYVLDWKHEVQRSQHLIRSQTGASAAPVGEEEGEGGGGSSSSGSGAQLVGRVESPDLLVLTVGLDQRGGGGSK